MAIRKFALTNEAATELGIYVKHYDFVRYVEIAKDDSFWITSCQDGTMRIWDGETCEPVAYLAGHEQILSCVALTQDKRIAISACYDMHLNVYETHMV
jgi:WD40 repeat protein